MADKKGVAAAMGDKMDKPEKRSGSRRSSNPKRGKSAGKMAPPALGAGAKTATALKGKMIDMGKGPATSATKGRVGKVSIDLSGDSHQFTGSSKKKKLSIDDFILIKVIGRGSFGKVFLAKFKEDGKAYALKVLKKHELVERRQEGNTASERMLLSKLMHPFMVNLRFAFQTPEKLYMVIDYINGGELFTHLSNQGRFSESRVRLYVAEIALALEFCHDNNIIYRDLKPENVLVAHNGHIRITDFGLSKELDTAMLDAKTNTFCGTPDYLAPEVLQRVAYGKQVDWWSLGALTFEMLTGAPPFHNQNLAVMYHKILNTEPKYPAFLSADAKSFLEGLLTKDPKKRLGAKGASEVRAHPFFKKIDWTAVFLEEIEAEWKPNVSGPEDYSQFSKEFTDETVKDSLVPENILDKPPSFQGFTFDERALNP